MTPTPDDDRDSVEEAGPRLDDGGPCNLVGLGAEDEASWFKDAFITILVLAAMALALWAAGRWL